MAVDPYWRLKTRFQLRRSLNSVLPLVDVLAFVPTALAGAYLRMMRRLGLHRMPLSRRSLEAQGVWPTLRHYYEPYFDRTMVRAPLNEPRALPGLALNTGQSLILARRLAEFANEPIVGRVAGGKEYVAGNGTYGLPDAALLYALVRATKPARLIEVGSGNSTLVTFRALERNREEGHECEHLCIEPFEMPWLEDLGVPVHRQMIEDVDPALFDGLQSGDMLFVDNSHVVRPQGDVVTIVQGVLPRLRPGVLIHIHDFFTPRDYTDSWLLEDRSFWTEQYLVEAFLTHNDQFEIVFAANHIYVDHREVFDEMRPELAAKDWHPPTALWVRRKVNGEVGPALART